MRLYAPAAILNPVWQIDKAPPAPVAQRVQRAITEQAVEILPVHTSMARKILTGLVLDKLILIHQAHPIHPIETAVHG